MNKSIRFLVQAEIEEIHDKGLRRIFGQRGIRDVDLLLSAIGQPELACHFGETSLLRLAASYAFHLTCNHPFIEGNKRAAAGAALLFLAVNGVVPVIDHVRLERLILEVSKGDFSKSEFIDLFLGLFSTVNESSSSSK